MGPWALLFSPWFCLVPHGKCTIPCHSAHLLEGGRLPDMKTGTRRYYWRVNRIWYALSLPLPPAPRLRLIPRRTSHTT